MQPNPNQPPAIQDSVVGRDMHTGNVIHNHYHLPSTQAAAQPPPQTIIIQQPAPQPNFQNQYTVPLQPLKKIYGTDWIILGALSILFSFIPILNVICGLVSVVGILSMLPHLHLKSGGHPESQKIVPALALNSIALFLMIFSWILYSS
ncbi:MAG: hypothetical protein QMC65_07625 [Candidatus Poseidoniaceae archaeon]